MLHRNGLRLLVLAGLSLVACTAENARHPTGTAGTNGSAGTGAAAGTTGNVAGVNGQAGTTAEAGVNGQAGTNGEAGTTAQAGTNGQAGTAAQAGSNGQAGTTAQAGTNGQAGTTPDAGVDAPVDAPTDSAIDAAADVRVDAAAEVATDAPHEAAVDAGLPEVGPTDGPGTFTNYCSSVHWTASASTPVNGANTPDKAIDGETGTRWTTGTDQVANQYFQIDFGGTVSLTQVVLDAAGNNATDYPRGYTIGLSANGTTFTQAATGTPAAGAAVTINFAAAQGRYLRVTQTGTGGNWWSIAELHVACTVPGVNPDAGLVDPYDPASWSATASKMTANTPPANAIDGLTTTRWATGADQVGGETFTLNLGAVAMVSEIWLDAGGAVDGPAMYKLEVSTNGTTFTTPATGATGAGVQLTKIVFPRQDVRYLRITQTGVAAHWWSIYDITIKP